MHLIDQRGGAGNERCDVGVVVFVGLVTWSDMTVTLNMTVTLDMLINTPFIPTAPPPISILHALLQPKHSYQV